MEKNSCAPLALLLLAFHGAGQEGGSEVPPDSLNFMTWNIWHGGREDGAEAGPEKVVDVIRSSGADVVAMQETYGSGELIAEELGFHFHPRGTNVSILSRFEVIEDLSVHEEFQCVGALLGLPGGERVAFYSIWLPYSAEIWAAGTRDVGDPGSMLAACMASEESLRTIQAAIAERLGAEEYEGVPVVIAGDFNSMSHLDYGEVGFDDYGVAIDWPTSRTLHDAGFRDAYRETHPIMDRVEDATWTPRFPDQEQDRIDFIYYRAERWIARSSTVIRSHPKGFPSDHAAVIATLARQPEPARELELRVVSYNIRHGAGMDGGIDLERTARVLAELRPDVIGLQEVDLGARRSGGVNQVKELGRLLEMHPAFGSFMDFQGGKYGLAVLSRHPVVTTRVLRLADGNEPRVALTAVVRAPSGQAFEVVNVHFDWKDEPFRLAQAREVASYVAQGEHPLLLMGDFNDQPGSATLNLFQEALEEIKKPLDERYTFSSDSPEKEIDFLFHSREQGWSTAGARVVPETLASDHRPVMARLTLSRNR